MSPGAAGQVGDLRFARLEQQPYLSRTAAFCGVACGCAVAWLCGGMAVWHVAAGGVAIWHVVAWQRGGVAMWWRGDAAVWWRGSVAVWQRGHVAVWRHGGMTIWHVAAWLCGMWRRGCVAAWLCGMWQRGHVAVSFLCLCPPPQQAYEWQPEFKWPGLTPDFRAGG